MARKRQIRGEKYDVSELVTSAIATVDASELDLEGAEMSLRRMGHRAPADALVIKFAREKAILAELQNQTGANFERQLGKIDFSGGLEKSINQVNSYLSRRVAGIRSNWKR